MADWTEEISVDGALARRLIGGQFPEIGLRSLEPLAEGWDNTVWLVDERLAFRFPRRTSALPGLQREMELLPRLAPLLPVPIPRPEYRGVPADGYPWPFFGGPYLRGREAVDAGLDDTARLALAKPLGAFLNRLHSREVAEAVAGLVDLPHDPMGRADMATRVPQTRGAIADVERLGLWAEPRSVTLLLDTAESLGPPDASPVVHGDLHFRHLLVDDYGDLTGVIDWGDVCRGCRSMDLQMLWSFLPPPARTSFLESYGPVGEEDLLRARVLALFLSAMLVVYGHETGVGNVEREALAGLERAATA